MAIAESRFCLVKLANRSTLFRYVCPPSHAGPGGSRYRMVKELGPNNHLNSYGLQALIPINEVFGPLVVTQKLCKILPFATAMTALGELQVVVPSTSISYEAVRTGSGSGIFLLDSRTVQQSLLMCPKHPVP